MDSVIQLEYIIERERSRGVSRRSVDADEVRSNAASHRFIGHVRRMVDLLRSAREAATYA